MDEEHVFRHVLFLYDEDTFKFKYIGNVMLQLDIAQQICARESFFTIFFLKAANKAVVVAR